MPEPLRVTIVVESCPDGKKEIFLFDPQDGREARTGCKVEAWRVREEVRKMKAAAEANGLRVAVKEC